MRRALAASLSPAVAVALLLTACGPSGVDDTVQAAVAEPEAPAGGAEEISGAEDPEGAADVVEDGDGAEPEAAAAPDPSVERPDWLGTRLLPLRPDGLGEIQPTPPELVDRRLATPSELPPPPSDGYHATVTEVPDAVVARSTWQPACPVGLDELRYVTVSFWGFDERHHTGELLIHHAAADGMVEVFRRLHEARFPIEEMRVTRADELDLHPTGDGNNSGAFVCRPSVGSTSWSQHAYGLAVDINPFHNPLLKGDIVVPELASAYTDRDDVRPGMIVEGDVVTRAFDDLDWPWGGRWSSAKDWMHFSSNGR